MRKAEHKVNELFLKRWSPRAMSGEEITNEELKSLFEAARWAPSSFNGQPWRFIYAKKNTQYWDDLFNLLVPANQAWCKNAAVLVVIISRKTFEYNNKLSKTHSFDTGAAWENLALQGFLNNLVIHGMEGFDYDKAQNDLNIPKDYKVEAMFAIGKHSKLEILPKELQEKDKILSNRKKIEEFIFEGKFEETK